MSEIVHLKAIHVLVCMDEFIIDIMYMCFEGWTFKIECKVNYFETEQFVLFLTPSAPSPAPTFEFKTLTGLSNHICSIFTQ